MKSNAVCLFAGLVLAVSSAFAQAINVTPTGVDIGATTPTTSGALLQQSGQTTTFWAQDGVNAPTLLVKIQGDGKVGVGTSTPSEQLTVSGNTMTSGSATVGSLIVGTSTIFSVGSFESEPQTIPGNGNSLTVAHGLGGIPKLSTVSLRCIVAEHGWAVGDEILISSVTMDSGNLGVTTAVNATSFKLSQTGASIYIHKFDLSAKAAPSIANWKIIFRAWR